MNERSSNYGYWTSSTAFVMVVLGAAIGLGNVWRLPWLAVEYGGGAFFLVYVIALCFMGLPLLMAEWLVGRRMRANVVTGAKQIAREAEARAVWRWIGLPALLGAVLVLSYYSPIAGWSLAYLVRSAGGVLNGIDAGEAKGIFLYLVGDPERAVAWHTMFMVTVTIFIAHGRAGVERVARYLVPMLFVVLAILFIHAASTASILDAIPLLLFPDFSRLGWEGVILAVHQAFFTFSLGMGVMMALGSYLPERTSLFRVGMSVLALDLLFSLVAGITVYAYLLGSGLPSVAGVPLIFEYLPLAMGELTFANLAQICLYLMLLLAALTSAVAIMEPLVVWVMERMDITRVFASTSACLLVWFLGLGTLLSFNTLADMTLYGRNFFGWVNWLSANLILPLSALLLCIFLGRIMPPEMLREAWGGGGSRSLALWSWCMRYPARISLIFLVLYAMGVIDAAIDFWRPLPGQPVPD